MATIGNSKRGMVFSVRSVLRCYNQDSKSQSIVAVAETGDSSGTPLKPLPSNV
jgi:hypothetical protein